MIKIADKIIIDLDTELWKQRVFKLNKAESLLEASFKSGKITKNERKELKKILNLLWEQNWKSYPDKNPSVEEAFELNFG